MSSQRFVVVPDDRYIVLQLQSANMDVEACDEMHCLLDEHVAKRDASVILDLTHAKFLPSLAIGALVNAKKRLDSAGRSLTIVGLAANIRRALELSALDKVFHLVERLEQATVVA